MDQLPITVGWRVKQPISWSAVPRRLFLLWWRTEYRVLKERHTPKNGWETAWMLSSRAEIEANAYD